MTNLSSTLLLIPCSARKQGGGILDLTTRELSTDLSPTAAEILREGRELAWQRRGTCLYEDSPRLPAAAYYSGNPYKTPGFRQLLLQRINEGLHCLIISGGYGLLLPEEPIHRYEAHLPTHTRTVWRPRIPILLRSYVAKHGTKRTRWFVSKGYAAVLPDSLTGDDRKFIPSFRRGIDEGSPITVVPQLIAEHAMRFLQDPTL